MAPATPEIFLTEEDRHLYSSLFDNPKYGTMKSRGMEIEKKIEFLERLTGRTSNRRSRRLLNDCLLMELVPRLNAEEIRGLFAPPPWGDNVPPSPFSVVNLELENFRNIDMDKEASFIKFHEISQTRCKGHTNADKINALKAWHRVECRTREALRRCFLSDIVNGYEQCLRSFVEESKETDVLVLHVQDPFHRLLLHGVCEFYNLVSSTVSRSEGGKLSKMTEIRKKGLSSCDLPNITLCQFLKMAKTGLR